MDDPRARHGTMDNGSHSPCTVLAGVSRFRHGLCPGVLVRARPSRGLVIVQTSAITSCCKRRPLEQFVLYFIEDFSKIADIVEKNPSSDPLLADLDTSDRSMA